MQKQYKEEKTVIPVIDSACQYFRFQELTSLTPFELGHI